LGVARHLCAQGAITFQYFYDDLGQLIKVIDSSGKEVDYTYDAVGNITAVTRSPAPEPGALAIFNFTPGQGDTGTTVTIMGQGFSSTPGANTVRFNGTAATVVSATTGTLVVTVAGGTTTGPISVTVGTATATSTSDFTAVPVPVITSLSRRSALFNTVITNLGVTGANLAGATFSFETTALTVTGVSTDPTGLSANLSMQVGPVAGTFALIARNSFGSSTPGITRSNRFTVVNPNSRADSDGDGLPDAVEAAFGTDPLDPNSLPNSSFPSSGEVNPLAFSVLNRAGEATSQEADATVFSVLNSAGQATSQEADATVFSALNLAGVTGGGPIRMEADAALFSVLNTEGSGGPGHPVAMEANGLVFSVLNLAGVSGDHPLQVEADGIPFSVNNTNPGAPLRAQEAASTQADRSPSGGSAPRNDGAVLNGKPLSRVQSRTNDPIGIRTDRSSKDQDSNARRRRP